jgi:hypothetical protein
MNRDCWYLPAEAAGFSAETLTAMRRGCVVTLRNLEMDWSAKRSWTQYVNGEQRAEIQDFLTRAAGEFEPVRVESARPGALLPPPKDALYHLRWLPRINRKLPIEALTWSGVSEETVGLMKERGKTRIGDLCKTAEVIVQDWLWEEYGAVRDAAMLFLQPLPALTAQLIDAVDRKTAGSPAEALYPACKPCLRLLAPVLAQYFRLQGGDPERFSVSQLLVEPYFSRRDSDLALRALRELPELSFDRETGTFTLVPIEEMPVRSPKPSLKQPVQKKIRSMWGREQ